MNQMNRMKWMLILLAALAQLGCTTQRETFAGHSPEQVWTALVAVAQTPDYADGDYTDRWTLRENNVWVDEQERRIEINRQLERELHQPLSQPRYEQREWKFRVTLDSNDPPVAQFSSRELGVPAHAWDEATRYFDDVWKVLGGRDSTAPESISD